MPQKEVKLQATQASSLLVGGSEEKAVGYSCKIHLHRGQCPSLMDMVVCIKALEILLCIESASPIPAARMSRTEGYPAACLVGIERLASLPVLLLLKAFMPVDDGVEEMIPVRHRSHPTVNT